MTKPLDCMRCGTVGMVHAMEEENSFGLRGAGGGLGLGDTSKSFRKEWAECGSWVATGLKPNEELAEGSSMVRVEIRQLKNALRHTEDKAAEDTWGVTGVGRDVQVEIQGFFEESCT